ncbi:SpoIIE family protein phosphatase [Streptosporangium sp. NBC_01495]|uniref:PP2C family protein-serine/threonine phosphatase n=1 Tax=Streptosporangium sp. NBC_01495 TaxID=2903899 RepID=UPI002E2FF745|nr:GAF domain-containing SpoIIE family protein phosphatase [Streptosporangium sp. NBC_01495]
MGVEIPAAVFDPKRLSAVWATGLLDTEPEPSFDDLARLAARVTGTRRAFVTLVDDRRSFWKSAIGMGEPSMSERRNAVSDSPCHILVATNEPLLVADAATDPRVRDLPTVERLGIGAWAGYPIHGPDGEVLGGLCVVDSVSRAWSDTDAQTLAILARAVSGEIRLRDALARSERHVVELQAAGKVSERLVRTLQDSLLPPMMPTVPGLQAAATYIPATGEVDVTGDFYDLFLASGSRWCAVLGDVCGHGVEAAQITALARYTLRADAPRHVSPSRVLEQLNRALLAQRIKDGRFLTVVCAIFRPDGDGFTGMLSTAGHPSALLRRADGSVESLRTPGVVLGIMEETRLGNVRFDLGPGDTLVLYSDGVTEAHPPRQQDLFGDERLIALLSECRDLDAGDIVRRIGDAALDHSREHMTDDMAILALRVPAP